MQNDTSGNIMLFDWISFTTQSMTPADLMEWLGLGEQDFQNFPGRYGYRFRQSFGGIHILSDGADPSMGVCVEMSGQGCRDWETFGNGDYLMLIRASVGGLISFTRIDIAFDDHSGEVPFDEVVQRTLDQEYCSIWRSWKFEKSNQGTSCMYGSRQSEIYMRIYDKAAERGFEDLHWIRIETVFKRDRAQELAKYIYRDNGLNQNVYFGILKHYINFCDPTDDTNPSRWPISDWWQALIDGAVEISLVNGPGEIYNLSNAEDQLFRQYGNSMLVVILCRGFDHFISRILSGNNYLRKKYKEICRMNGVVDEEITYTKAREIKRKIDYLAAEYMGYDIWSEEDREEDDD